MTLYGYISKCMSKHYVNLKSLNEKTRNKIQMLFVYYIFFAKYTFRDEREVWRRLQASTFDGPPMKRKMLTNIHSEFNITNKLKIIWVYLIFVRRKNIGVKQILIWANSRYIIFLHSCSFNTHFLPFVSTAGSLTFVFHTVQWLIHSVSSEILWSNYGSLLAHMYKC